MMPMSNQHSENDVVAELARLRDANRRLQDKASRLEKENQSLRTMLRVTENRCDVYQRHLMSRLSHNE